MPVACVVGSGEICCLQPIDANVWWLFKLWINFLSSWWELWFCAPVWPRWTHLSQIIIMATSMAPTPVLHPLMCGRTTLYPSSSRCSHILLVRPQVFTHWLIILNFCRPTEARIPSVHHLASPEHMHDQWLCRWKPRCPWPTYGRAWVQVVSSTARFTTGCRVGCFCDSQRTHRGIPLANPWVVAQRLLIGSTRPELHPFFDPNWFTWRQCLSQFRSLFWLKHILEQSVC